MSEARRITRITAHSYRCPVEVPVETSFGIMRDRPAVFIRIEDQDGAFGWGEAFTNWPAAGAEHRVNLLDRDLSHLILGRAFAQPEDMFAFLERETHIRALQCGEQGPFRQVIAGLDTALWDLFARRAGVPLRRLLNPNAPDTVAAYASGIHIRGAAGVIDAARAQGFGAFKVKVGFDEGRDAPETLALLHDLRPGEALAADANQAWDLARAARFTDRIGEAGLLWLEEPLPADAPDADWDRLARATEIPLAGGENLAGFAEFERGIARGHLAVLQPDLAKWGGITGCRRVAADALGHGRRYCPHYLGGGIGLLASAELLAASGGDGLLEVDSNPNPLRDALAPMAAHMSAAGWRCAPSPGLGVEELPETLTPFRTHSIDIHA